MNKDLDLFHKTDQYIKNLHINQPKLQECHLKKKILQSCLMHINN